MQNFMTFFDYVFYRVSNVYIKKWKDAHGFIYGIGMVSMMQLAHIFFFMDIIALISPIFNSYFFESTKGKNFMHSGIIFPCLVIFGYNFFRYLKLKPFKSLENKWKEEKGIKKIKKGWLIFIYIICNI